MLDFHLVTKRSRVCLRRDGKCLLCAPLCMHHNNTCPLFMTLVSAASRFNFDQGKQYLWNWHICGTDPLGIGYKCRLATLIRINRGWLIQWTHYSIGSGQQRSFLVSTAKDLKQIRTHLLPSGRGIDTESCSPHILLCLSLRFWPPVLKFPPGKTQNLPTKLENRSLLGKNVALLNWTGIYCWRKACMHASVGQHIWQGFLP